MTKVEKIPETGYITIISFNERYWKEQDELAKP